MDVPYLHVLSDHVPVWMDYWFTMLGWGYGMFSSSSGEHLNKVVKHLELCHSNLSGNRFAQIVRLMRTRLLFYPEMLFDQSHHKVKCSACHQEGHNKKSRMCPLHPSQPALEFDDDD